VDRALGAAGVAPSEVVGFCAHGTGTRECQDADHAVLRHLGPQATGSGLKPLIGHTMAPASLLDAVALARAQGEGALPVHGQLAGSYTQDLHHDARLPVGAALPSGVRPERDADGRSAGSASILDDLPLTSSYADPAAAGDDAMAVGTGPTLQLSLGFGGNICAAVYRAPA
jgi:hypothetical protein